MLQGKKVVLGVTGGIAAYKCAELVRLLVKEGALVRVVMTREATNFVTPQTLAVLSKQPVTTDFFDHHGDWNNHVHLALWADVMLVAPLTANTLAKMAVGTCDNLLLATYLSARSLVMVAPAMDLDMYRHDTVKKNLDQLKNRGHIVIPAETGELASGLSGEGRMAEPQTIVNCLREHFEKNKRLSGQKALVNAGPTHEPIDPVRFIGNRSSGKMGIAIAEKLADEGAAVTLVLGPTAIAVNHPAIAMHRVETSHDMYEAMVSRFEGMDIVVCAAAIADYRPLVVATEKIKKTQADMALQLVSTSDILKELGQRKTKQCLVGFALETGDLEANARLKLDAKHLDIIVANSASEPGAGFGGDTNRVTILDKHNKITKFELKPKQQVATDIVNYIIAFIKK